MRKGVSLIIIFKPKKNENSAEPKLRSMVKPFLVLVFPSKYMSIKLNG